MCRVGEHLWKVLFGSQFAVLPKLTQYPRGQEVPKKWVWNAILSVGRVLKMQGKRAVTLSPLFHQRTLEWGLEGALPKILFIQTASAKKKFKNLR